jgi:hypothetical protein
MITICQCNIHDGGKWTGMDRSVVTYDTARRFASFVASVNPEGSAYPPISAIGMQELVSEIDRSTIEGYLETYTNAEWDSLRVPQGVNGGSGIGMFWRKDLLETYPEWDLGDVTVERLDSGYEIKFTGRLFRKPDDGQYFALITGKLAWRDAVLNGRKVTEERRQQEALELKEWVFSRVSACEFPVAAVVIATDLNTGVGSAAWKEMSCDYTDPSRQHTFNSFTGQSLMDTIGLRLDYIWLAAGNSYSRFVGGPSRSVHFGSDHRAVCATIDLAGISPLST